jgi:hypothetical protein
LVKDEIQVYAVTVSLPVLDAGTSSLQAYANATGGEVYSGRTNTGMQDAFARITEQARHEYVLTYVSNNEVSGLLPVSRKIEVKTVRPGLKLHHRSEYLQYPRHLAHRPNRVVTTILFLVDCSNDKGDFGTIG